MSSNEFFTDEKEKNINIEEDKKAQNKTKKYISFNMRILLISILAFVFLCCSIFMILSSLSITKLESINYKETSSIDYKVYLKENEFFTDEYLDKNMTYIASLIKNIKVNFNYLFTIDKSNTMDISYDVKGKLVILNPKDNQEYFHEDYSLLDTKTDTILESNSYSINKEVTIDYDYYNNRANKFKYSYGVETESYLNVYLTVKGKNKGDNSFNINNNSVIALKIPLSEKSINIKLDYKNLNENKKIFSNQKTQIGNRIIFILGSLFAIISIILIMKLIRLIVIMSKKKSKYDRYIHKLLREYDRLIINTKTPPKLEGFNIIKVDSFQELLDARDNVKGAIKYYVVTEHQKCNFYFTHDNDLYLLTIKEVDIMR